MPPLRVALAQLNVTVGDLEGNRRLIGDAICRARAWMADVVVVPELAITGYPPEDLLLKPQFVEANRLSLERLTPLARGLIALVGFVDRDPQGRLYNAAAVLAEGRRVASYRKQYLPNYGVFDEQRYFAAGSGSLILDLDGVRVGLTICEDLWEQHPCEALAASGAQVVVNLSASPYHAGKLNVREALFGERARDNRLAVAYCNVVGGQDELVFDGASLFLDAQGREIAHARQFQPDLLVRDLAVGPPRAMRRAPHAVRVIRVAHRILKRPPLRCEPIRRLTETEEVYEALTLGVRDYVRKNRFSTVVLGLSGGIDSALTACLAVDALGAANVNGVVMPSRFSSEATQTDARALTRALGIELLEMSIEPIFTAYGAALQPFFGDRPPDVTEQNIQARIRGHLLMALSNKFGWLVLTTGNKSELATGYCTLYGDMAGGFAVIKDVPKTLVYRLARFRNQRGPGRPIAESIMTRVPTAELAPNQTDQDTLPPYETLDRIIKAYVEEDRSFQEIFSLQRVDPALVAQVLQMVDRAEYKRRQGAPGIKITPKAFGKDRRMPITNRFQES
ncbi:MAG: NAD+ synthase [Candidatus Omnitrophica bacterium]|nr:NAD+ synthase [Candidatus Omnitrophota bacterium]